MLEIVISKHEGVELPDEAQEVVKAFKYQETDDRYRMTIPLDWEGLRDGRLQTLFRVCGDDLYGALAYFTTDSSEIVTDFDGNRVERMEATFDGKMAYKYLKRKLQILKIMDEEKNIFRVTGYAVNFRFPNPAVKVLDVYSIGSESKIFPDLFLRRQG
jgi:hypothetical protein